MDARVGMVVEGGQRALNSAAAAAHGTVVDTGARKFIQPHGQSHSKPPPPQPSSFSQQQAPLGSVQHMLAGGVAGAFSKTCTAPMGRLTILFQIQGMHSDVTALSKPCVWREACRIFNEEGFKAFWRGNLVTIVHRVPYSAVNFYAYEKYKTFLQSVFGLERQGGNSTADLAVRFLGGGLAGISAASATYPLDLVRTRLAAQRDTIYYRGIWDSFRTICKEEGYLGLYKGVGPTLLGVGPNLAIGFCVYESLKSFWESRRLAPGNNNVRPNDSTTMVSLSCGSLSGVAASTATFPIDLVRRRMQLEGAGGKARVYTGGLLGTFRHIIKNEGLLGLYRGILPEYYKVVPGVAIVFMTYETLKIALSGSPPT
ncbi:Mitochondrial substrate carrier family protein B [Linum perenne]